MDQLLSEKILIHYQDGYNEIVDSNIAFLLSERSVGTTFESVDWTQRKVIIPMSFNPGKYLVRYLMNVPIKFYWFTPQKQVDIFFEFLSFGIPLRKALDYTKVGTDVLRMLCSMDLGKIIESDKGKVCENQLLEVVTPQDRLQVTRFYYNETAFLNGCLEGTVTEETLNRRKQMGAVPTAIGKHFINRNISQCITAIVAKGKSLVSERMFQVLQEYTDMSYETFIKDVERLCDKWRAEGNEEMLQHGLDYIGQQEVGNTLDDSSREISFDTDLLKIWTGMRNYRVVYNKAFSEMNLSEFNSKICGLSNMMLIVTTDSGCVFGSFTSTTVPPPMNWVKKDASHFLFTLRSPLNMQPTRFFPLKPANSVYIFQDDYMISFIAVQGGFKINTKTDSSFSSRFTYYYNDSVGYGPSVFVPTPDRFRVKSVTVLEFY